MDMAWLNLGSLVLGMAAWVLPLIGVGFAKKTGNKKWIFPVASIGACAAALYMQILYQGHLVAIADWSAMMDTYEAVSFICSVLLFVTILLNVIVIFLYLRKNTNAEKA